MDGGLEGDGKDPGGKDPGGKDPGDKQFSGWAGDAETWKFTLYAGGALVCDITYPWVDRAEAAGCDDCAFAWRGTLGEATEDTNVGDCEQATGLTGTERAFGHGTTADAKGYHPLYTEEGDRWNVVPNGGSFEKEEKWGYFIVVDAPDEGGGGEDGIVFVGHFDDGSLEGTWSMVGIRDGNAFCEHRYPLVSPSAAECAGCDFAWNFDLGAREIVTDGEACSAFGDLTGLPVDYGHADPDVLYGGKDGDWTRVAGTSTYEAPVWDFRNPLMK